MVKGRGKREARELVKIPASAAAMAAAMASDGSAGRPQRSRTQMQRFQPPPLSAAKYKTKEDHQSDIIRPPLRTAASWAGARCTR